MSVRNAERLSLPGSVRVGHDANAVGRRRELFCGRSRKGNVLAAVHERAEPVLPRGLLCWIPPLLCRFWYVSLPELLSNWAHPDRDCSAAQGYSVSLHLSNRTLPVLSVT